MERTRQAPTEKTCMLVWSMPLPTLNLSTNQNDTVTLSPVVGNPPQPGVLPPGSIPQWTSENPSVVSVAAAPDGMSAVVTSNSTPGTVQIDVVAQTLTGSLFTSSFDVVVAPAQATSFNFVFGTPQNN